MIETATLPDRMRLWVRMTPITVFRLSLVVLAGGLALWMAAPESGARVLGAGLLLLMAVPLLRVTVLLAVFVWRRDWYSAGMTAAVLGVVITTIVIALSH
jgi:hypothetical protein